MADAWVNTNTTSGARWGDGRYAEVADAIEALLGADATDVHNTGGGCLAIEVERPNGTYVLTLEDITEFPCWALYDRRGGWWDEVAEEGYLWPDGSRQDFPWGHYGRDLADAPADAVARWFVVDASLV